MAIPGHIQLESHLDDEYGAFTAIYGTIVTSLVSLAIAVPLGVGTAIFITESFIPKRARELIGLMVELLAAIPSVVLGLWAIFVLEPVLRPLLTWLHDAFGFIPLFKTVPQGLSMTPAILVLVVMILPIITAISRDSSIRFRFVFAKLPTVLAAPAGPRSFK